MRTIQSNEESTANFKEALKDLKTDLALDQLSALALDGYLVKHNTNAEGLVDMSTANIRAAIYALKDILPLTVAPTAPRTTNAQSQLNVQAKSNRETREEQAEKERLRNEAREKEAADEKVKDIAHQAERIFRQAGGNLAIRSAARRADGEARLRRVWSSYLQKFSPEQALATLKQYWKDVDERDLYRAEGAFNKLDKVDAVEMKVGVWKPKQ